MGKALLLVEDDPLVAGAVERVLRTTFRRIVVVATAAAALVALRSARFDVVLSDLELGPGETSGAELLAHVAEEWPQLRRVLHTGNPHALAGAAHVVVRKPATAAELVKAMTPAPCDNMPVRPGNAGLRGREVISETR